MKNTPYYILVIAIIVYFGVSAIGKRAFEKEQIEATRLHMQVLWDIKLRVHDLAKDMEYFDAVVDEDEDLMSFMERINEGE